jgi:hypothetical protein
MCRKIKVRRERRKEIKVYTDSPSNLRVRSVPSHPAEDSTIKIIVTRQPHPKVFS